MTRTAGADVHRTFSRIHVIHPLSSAMGLPNGSTGIGRPAKLTNSCRGTGSSNMSRLSARSQPSAGCSDPSPDGGARMFAPRAAASSAWRRPPASDRAVAILGRHVAHEAPCRGLVLRWGTAFQRRTSDPTRAKRGRRRGNAPRRVPDGLSQFAGDPHLRLDTDAFPPAVEHQHDQPRPGGRTDAGRGARRRRAQQRAGDERLPACGGR